MWNVYNQGTRTNNKLEGWHNALNRLVKKCYPNIYELITTLKAVQSTTGRTMRSARLGAQPPPMRRKAKSRQQKIQILEEQLSSGQRSITEYLGDMCRHVGFKCW
jgi:hypothetical protein